MDIKKRRVAAYLAGRLISGIRSTRVYDYTKGASFKMVGEVSSDYLLIYDYDRYSYIIGNNTPAGLAIYDYYTRETISLKTTGSTFYGYDYETSSYLSGTVNKRLVTLFDHQVARDFKYSI